MLLGSLSVVHRAVGKRQASERFLVQESLFNSVESTRELELQCDHGRGLVGPMLHLHHRGCSGDMTLEQNSANCGEQCGLAELISFREDVHTVGQAREDDGVGELTSIAGIDKNAKIGDSTCCVE
jgi:hypothetical protein